MSTMNLNDYRLNAYNKVKGNEQSDLNKKDDVNSEPAKVESLSSQIRHNSKPGTEPLIYKPVFERINKVVDDSFKKNQSEEIHRNFEKTLSNAVESQRQGSFSTKKNLSRGSEFPSAEDLKAQETARLAARNGTWFAKKNTTEEEVKEAAAKLTSGGLIMVPAQEKSADENESIYRRVAKFLVVIGTDEAAKILPHLTEEQTEKIIPEIASIRYVSPEEANQVLDEFKALLTKARESGGVDTARTILTKVYGSEKADQVLQKVVKHPNGKPFDYLADANAERIGILLDGESAGVQALVLSQIEPAKAAKVINRMEPRVKSEVVLRLAKMKPVAPAVIEQLNKSLHEKMMTQNTENSQNLDGRGVLAQILKRMDPGSEYAIITNLCNTNPELGADLRKRLFTEEDVVGCDDRYLQKKLHDMIDSDIVILLRGKSDEFRNKILQNVSKNRARTIVDEEFLKEHILRSDSEKITSQFYSELRRAWEVGELVIKGRDDEEYV